MSQKLIDAFYWRDAAELTDEPTTDAEKYKTVVTWARKARGKNPRAFDAVTGWVLDDSEWTDEKLALNRQILMEDMISRFKEQNARLREYLAALEPSGVVNPAAFRALDRFDGELSGKTGDKKLTDTVARIFADFSEMRERGVREQIAGNKTGPSGTDNVEMFGYINYLKECDAAVQWTLFMPDMVKKQQNGFKLDSFEYKKMPALRFIGKESGEKKDAESLKALFGTLDGMAAHKSGFDYDLIFFHHYGLGVDAEDCHGFWGRFMRADTPVPEGFLHFDFIPQREEKNFKAGPPFLSQFAFSIFSGDTGAIQKCEGFDVNAMYDITRNIMLGEGVNIPYPHKYWTAEVFMDGFDKHGAAYIFSAEL